MKLYLIDNEGEKIFEGTIGGPELTLTSEDDYNDIDFTLGATPFKIYKTLTRHSIGISATLLSDSQGKMGMFNKDLLEANGVLVNIEHN